MDVVAAEKVVEAENIFEPEKVLSLARRVVDAPVNPMLVPVHVLLFANSVVLATVMFAEPSKETPLMVTGLANFVAVLALPVNVPVSVLENVFVPLHVLLLERVEVDMLSVFPFHESAVPAVMAFDGC